MLTKIRHIPFSQDVNATFLTFYHQFVTDKTFQGNSLAESVKFVGPDPDDDFNVIQHYYLGDQEALKAKMEAVANQGKKK